MENEWYIFNKLGLPIGRDPIRNPDLRPLDSWKTIVENGENLEGPGCPVECIYCNQRGMDKDENGNSIVPYISFTVDGGISLNTRLMVGRRLIKKIEPTTVVQELIKNPFYNKETPILAENFNDPGVDWETTLQLMKEVFEKGHIGPIVFITKLGINDSYVYELTKLKEQGAKVIGIITYSGMPKGIEGNSESVRIGTLKKLHNAGIPTILSIRPIIEGVNASPDNFKKILLQTNGLADAIIAGGLFVFDKFTFDEFAKAGYPLPSEYSEDIYSRAKFMPGDYKKELARLVQELGIQTIFHRHTTCAIYDLSERHYGFNRPDRFPHWFSHNKNHFSECGHCSGRQRNNCEKAYSRDSDEVIRDALEALRHIGYPHLGIKIAELPSNPSRLLLVQGGGLSYEEIAFLRQTSGWYVDNLPNENDFRVLAERVLRNLGLSFDIIQEYFLQDDQWHIQINPDIPDKERQRIIRELRSQMRHRVQLL
jgi:DNA repair photolyase